MDIGKRNLLHYPEYPQVHGKQYTKRKGKTKEVHGLSRRPCPRAVHRHLRNLRCHEGLWIRFCRLGGAGCTNLGMVNITSEIRSESHGGQRCNEKQRCCGDNSTSRATATPRLPQGDPGGEASEF